jgi:hypothetical protein
MTIKTSSNTSPYETFPRRTLFKYNRTRKVGSNVSLGGIENISKKSITTFHAMKPEKTAKADPSRTPLVVQRLDPSKPPYLQIPESRCGSEMSQNKARQLAPCNKNMQITLHTFSKGLHCCTVCLFFRFMRFNPYNEHAVPSGSGV